MNKYKSSSNIRVSTEYEKGFTDGYKEGLLKGLEELIKNNKICQMYQPLLVKNND